MVEQLVRSARKKYQTWYRHPPVAAGYAPGRVEVLGNHTDYNDGFVLSAAIDYGTVFLAAPSDGNTASEAQCRLVAGDLMEEVSFPVESPRPFSDCSWANYVVGVVTGLNELGVLPRGFNGLFFGNVPIGSGLSSSAALEISAGMALASMSGQRVDSLEMARIAQRAEHEFVGARTGLMDQISSLFGEEGRLVHTDFRNLNVRTVPFAEELRLLVCDTGVSHSLGESDYNRRREACEKAVSFFTGRIEHRVTALRDISSDELTRAETDLDPEVLKRALHVVEENERVVRGVSCLESGDFESFGRLMYDSHRSSRYNFENSCEELDFIVDTTRKLDGVLGARLSGGGFGGSAVVLTWEQEAESLLHLLRERYEKRFGYSFVGRVIKPSRGARSISDV